MPYHLILVEDESAASFVYAGLQQSEDYCCTRMSWRELMQTSSLRDADLILVSINTVSPEASAAFHWLDEQRFAVPTLAILPQAADESLVTLATRAADDFVLMPLHEPELRVRMQRMLAERSDAARASDHLIEELAVAQLGGRSEIFLHAIRQVPRFARNDMPVLVTGETGTGKELCARALHQLGRRRDRAFVAVDCGTISEHLFESELFGHVRGAFTGADRERQGLITVAEGGTLFLDEIDALSLSAQAKLLRFLQEHTFRPVGSDRVGHANVKVIAATNRDLEQCVNDKLFRADLYFRLNVLHVHLPPLRQRVGDVEILAQGVLNDVNAVTEGSPKSFTRAALRALAAHPWPGNVRELSNVVQRAVVSSDAALILPAHLQLSAAKSDAGELSDCELGEFRTARAAAVAAFERQYIEALLRKHHGNVTQAAREARQDRRAFGRFIKKYQIDRTAL